MKKIKYKSLFNDWKEVTKEQAIRIAEHLFYSGVTNSNKKIDYINSRFQGIRFTINQHLKIGVVNE